MKYEFLENKNFSPNGYDVVSVKKGDKVEVPENLVEIYLGKKIIKKIDGVDYSHPVKQKPLSSKELEKLKVMQEQLKADQEQLAKDREQLKVDQEQFEIDKKDIVDSVNKEVSDIKTVKTGKNKKDSKK